jgi:hypothetical protein
MRNWLDSYSLLHPTSLLNLSILYMDIQVDRTGTALGILLGHFVDERWLMHECATALAAESGLCLSAPLQMRIISTIAGAIADDLSTTPFVSCIHFNNEVFIRAQRGRGGLGACPHKEKDVCVCW